MGIPGARRRHVPANMVVELRKSAGISQRELAAALGREPNFVARIETGQRRLDLIEWVQVLRALGADPEKEIAGIVRQVSPLKAKKRA